MEKVADTMRWPVAMGVGLVMMMGGCHTGALLSESPGWLSQVPGGQEELCAIGVSGPTYYPEDAMVRSKAQAMTELARTLEVKVKAHMLIRERGDSRGSEATIIEEARFTSDVVLRQAQVKEQWIHPGGDVQYGVRGMVYTLACMPVPR